MNPICIDLDGTISADPGLYREAMRAWMKDRPVHVLTGNPQAQHELAQLGMVKGRDFTCVAVVPKKHIGSTKIAYMRRVGATHIVDNRGATCKLARKAGFTAHHHMHPKKDK